MESDKPTRKISPSYAWSWTEQRLLAPINKAVILKFKMQMHLFQSRPHLSTTSLIRTTPGGSVSDHFLWRGDVAGTRFVAENALALLTAEPIEVLHRLTIYDENGKLFREFNYDSSEPYAVIEPGGSGPLIGTFIHSTFYDTTKLNPDQKLLLDLQRWHRGYCEYRRRPDSVWSSVHGNFGGITSEAKANNRYHRLLARARGTFLYTPQYLLRNTQTVTAYFLNSCPNDQTIEVFFTPKGADCNEHSELVATLKVPPLGVRQMSVSKKEGYITCRSRMPVCRPLIFAEEEGMDHHFDVFHT
jgi:hypothetical protein